MKLHLPKALVAALMAGMVGNLSVSELRAESIDYSKYASTANTTALTTNLVYANSFTTADTVDYTTGAISFAGSDTGTPLTVIDGQGKLTGQYKATGLGGEGKLGNSGFAISFDLIGMSGANWSDLLTLTTSDLTNGGGEYDLQLQLNNLSPQNLSFYSADSSAALNANKGFSNANSVTFGNNQNHDVLTPSSANKNTITLVYDTEAAAVKCYVDGVLTASATYGYADGVTPASVVRGIYFGSSSNGSRAFTNATIDNLAIWDGSLSDAQVKDLIILKWSGAEGSSSAWADINGGAATRTQVVATVTPTETEGDAATWTFGTAENAVAAGITDFTVSGGALKMDVTEGSSLALGSAQLVDNGSLTVNGNATISAASLAANTALALGSGATLAVDATNLDNQGTIFFAEGGKLNIAGAANGQSYTVGTLEFADGVEFDDVIGNGGRLSATYADKAVSFSITAANLVWDGTTSDVWTDYTTTWVNDASAQDTFYSGDSVTFNNATVSQQGDFSVGTMTVDNSAITFSGNVNATGTITVSGETTLAVADGGSLTHAGINVAGSGVTNLTLDGVDATFSADDTMTVDGSTLNVSGGATVKLHAGTTGSSGAILQNTTVTVNKATLEMNADALGWSGHGNTIILTSDDADSLAVFKNTAGNASNTFCMDIQMQGNSRITSGEFNTFGTNFTVSGTNNIIESEVQMRSASNVTLASGATLTLTKLSNHGEGVGTLTIKGSGAVTVNALGNGFSHNVVVEGGSLQLDYAQGADANLSTFKTETNGTLKLKLATTDAGSKVTLNGDSSGALEVLSGTINFAANNASSIGNSKLILDHNTTLCFAISGNNNSINVFNDIDVKGAVNLRAYGATGNTAANTLSGDINGETGSSIRKTDGGDITLTGEVTVDTVYVAAGNLILGEGNTTSAKHVRLSENGAAGNTLRIDEGATLTLTGTPDNTHNKAASLVLAHFSQTGFLVVDGGTLEASNVKALMSWDGTGTMKVLSGTAKLLGLSFWANSGFKGNFELGDEGTASNAVLEIGGAGFENVGGNASIKLGNGTIKLAADSKIVYNTDYSAGTVQLVGTNGGTVFDTNGHNFIINMHNVTGGGDLVKKGAGALTFGRQLAAGHITVEAGTLNLNGATTITSTIINDGTLAFGTGSSLAVADLDGLAKSGSATYSDTTAGDNVNGYISTTYVLVKSATDGNETDVTGLLGTTVNGITVTKNAANEYVLSTSGSSGDYFINDGTVTYNTASTANEIASTATTGIVLNGTTARLDMETSLRESVGVSVNASSTIAIGANATLNKSSVTVNNGSALTLEGTGTYVIADANMEHSGDSNSLAGYLNANLGDGWNGVVKFQGGDFWGTDIDTITSGSVELCGVKGMFITSGL